MVKIFITTDNHLGYKENDYILKNDSFRAFEETINTAISNKVDFILQAGDLFDEHKPTLNSLEKCIKILKKLKNKENNSSLNYYDIEDNSHLNFDGLPIISIHGNHDYPSGIDFKSINDLLQTIDTIKYIGKVNDTSTNIIIKPIIINNPDKKFKISIFGISYIHSKKFNRLIKERKIAFEDSNSKNNSFNILMVHQNKNKGCKEGTPPEDCLDPELLPDIFNLIIWGHEHESKVAEKHADRLILQPGSTIPTSISKFECTVRQNVILNINLDNLNYDFDYIPLKYQRKMIIHTQDIHKYEDFENLINNIKNDFENSNLDLKPFLRIKIINYMDDYNLEYEKHLTYFQGKVANDKNIFLIRKAKDIKKSKNSTFKFNNNDVDNLMTDSEVLAMKENKKNMNDKLNNYWFNFIKNKNNTKIVDFDYIKKNINNPIKNELTCIIDQSIDKLLIEKKKTLDKEFKVKLDDIINLEFENLEDKDIDFLENMPTNIELKLQKNL